MHIADNPLVSNEANLYQFLIFSDTVISPKVRCFVLCSFCHRTFAKFRRKLEKYRFEVKLVSYDFANYRCLTSERT